MTVRSTAFASCLLSALSASVACAPADSGSSEAAETTGSAITLAPGAAVFTVVLENQDYADIVGSPNAPYINSLIAKYGLATSYADSGVHPSLPNYLTMISGAPQYPGQKDLDPTHAPFPVDQPNLGDQLEAARISWRSYQESMGSPCKLSASGNYAPKHDPFLYFKSMQAGPNGLCARTNVDAASFAADLAAGTYRYMWLTPDLVDDGHNPTQQPVTGLKDADAWASSEIPKIMASPGYVNGGVIFLTWDEAEGRHGNPKDRVPMIVISSRIVRPGFQSAKPYSHKSYLATVEDLLGLPRLATVAAEPTLAEFLR